MVSLIFRDISLYKIEAFLCRSFLKGVLSYNKVVNVAHYLTVSLRGPVLTLRRGALRRVVTGGRVGRVDGWDGNQKRPLIFVT